MTVIAWVGSWRNTRLLQQEITETAASCGWKHAIKQLLSKNESHLLSDVSFCLTTSMTHSRISKREGKHITPLHQRFERKEKKRKKSLCVINSWFSSFKCPLLNCVQFHPSRRHILHSGGLFKQIKVCTLRAARYTLSTWVTVWLLFLPISAVRTGCVSGRDRVSALALVRLRDGGSGRKDNLSC